ncbi:MAG TPA: hypothetical protein VH092_04335 [Urbifossiella sp.]|jgi:hypothetical protein|nr:hypothetical protein [Urbifossiella sp.]
MARLLLTVLVVGLVVAAAEAQTLPVAPTPREVVHYFPTQVGAKWVYLSGDEEVIEVATKAQPKDGTTVVSIELQARGAALGTWQLAISAEGVDQLGVMQAVFDSPHCLLKVKARPGDRWEVREEKVFDFRATYTARGEEVVEVPAGRFRVLKVEKTVVFESGAARMSATYFAPGVGVVKEVVRQMSGEWTTTRELKSFTTGPDRAP